MSSRLPPHLDDDTPLSERYLYPGDWWGGNDDELSKEQRKHLLIRDMDDAEVVAITDNDADGLGTMAVIAEAYAPDQHVTHIESGHSRGVFTPTKALEFLVEFSDIAAEWSIETIYVTDLCLDGDDLDTYVDLFEQLNDTHEIHVFDHHEWSDDAKAQVRDVVTSLVVSEDDVCATDITFNVLREQMEARNPAAVSRMEELARVTRDHDLWIKEDDRSDEISDFAFWSDASTYVKTVRQYGPDVTQDAEIADMLEAKRTEKEQRIKLAVENADWFLVGAGLGRTDDAVDYLPWEAATDETRSRDDVYVVALAYGDVYHSEVGNRLTNGSQEKQADVAAIIQPWDKVSLRSRESFTECAAIMRTLGGGGHAHAASGNLNIFGANGRVEYSTHWETEGATAKRMILETMATYFQTND